MFGRSELFIERKDDETTCPTCMRGRDFSKCTAVNNGRRLINNKLQTRVRLVFSNTKSNLMAPLIIMVYYYFIICFFFVINYNYCRFLLINNILIAPLTMFITVIIIIINYHLVNIIIRTLLKFHN